MRTDDYSNKKVSADGVLPCARSLLCAHAVIVGSECKRAKPYPDPYEDALKHFGLRPGEAIVIEVSASYAKRSSSSDQSPRVLSPLKRSDNKVPLCFLACLESEYLAVIMQRWKYCHWFHCFQRPFDPRHFEDG
jgi:hypothetical protein